MQRPRIRHPRPATDGDGNGGDERVVFEPRQLTGLFTPPEWLDNLGRSAWLAVGVTLLTVGVVWLLTLTQSIVLPVLSAGVVAAVLSPLVRRGTRHGLGRGVASGLLLLGIIVLSLAVVVLVLAGIKSQSTALSEHLSSAKDTIAGWLKDLGVSQGSVDQAKQDASSTLGDVVPALLKGVGGGIKALSSLVFFLGLTALALFFLLKDGPLIRHWAEGHMRVPRPVAHQMTGRILQSLRGYFLGVTIVAGFNAVVVFLGALLLGVPLPGTIAAVTFIGAYIPYLGAWGAGAFAVLIALGGAGTDAAIGMAVVQLLANGILQQLVQPIAYGATLGIHPLAVLIVTIAGGSLFGTVGLILAAPLTSAATRIAADLSAAQQLPVTAPVTPAAPSTPAPVP